MGFSVTCQELPGLMRDLRQVDRNLANEMKRGIRKAEQPAKRLMQQSALAASNGPMMKASRAVKVNNRFSGKQASLRLRVDSGIAPNARPLDKPNNGSTNRHPVWGHRWRVNQPAHYFFNRGADQGLRACEKEMEGALNAVVRALAG